MDEQIICRKKFYSHLMQKGDLVFDVGANFGNRTEVFLELGAVVVAVEPQEECACYLRDNYGNRPNLIVLEQALGASAGEAELFGTTWSPISSMSTEWMESVRTSGRFADYEWKPLGTVSVTTLDHLIAQYGMPAFCKIDVEGYEFEVLQGLSRPLPALSFEYTKEHIQAAIQCVHHLAALGSYLFNVSFGESMQWASEDWLGPNDLLPKLLRLIEEPEGDWGDVYAIRHDS